MRALGFRLFIVGLGFRVYGAASRATARQATICYDPGFTVKPRSRESFHANYRRTPSSVLAQKL